METTRCVNYQQQFKSCISVSQLLLLAYRLFSKVLLYVNVLYGFDKYICMLCHVAIMVHLN